MHLKRYIYLMLLAIIAVVLPSCSEEEGPTPPNNSREVKTSILLYAVASNNLYFNYLNDIDEIRTAASSINFDEADVLVYSVTPYDMPQLMRLVNNDDGTFGFRTLKEYTRDVYSTDPQRIREVINDYISLSSADARGLILWSHASSWSPNFSDHMVPEPDEKSADISVKESVSRYSSSGSTGGRNSGDYSGNNSGSSMSTSSGGIAGNGIIGANTGMVIPGLNNAFGQDEYLGKSDYCDLIELETAIPDDTFNFIWFDCCYMASIEVIYQLRRKADYFIASPNELAGEGQPYQLTIPFIAKKDYNLFGAVDAEAEYFKQNNVIFALSLIDVSAIEDVADAAKEATSGTRALSYRLLNYGRYSYKYYDFGQYIRCWGETADNDWNLAAFDEAMERLIPYKASSVKNWNNSNFNDSNFSGISTHYYYDDDQQQNAYYRTLDWYERFYPGVSDLF